MGSARRSRLGALAVLLGVAASTSVAPFVHAAQAPTPTVELSASVGQYDSEPMGLGGASHSLNFRVVGGVPSVSLVESYGGFDVAFISEHVLTVTGTDGLVYGGDALALGDAWVRGTDVAATRCDNGYSLDTPPVLEFHECRSVVVSLDIAWTASSESSSTSSSDTAIEGCLVRAGSVTVTRRSAHVSGFVDQAPLRWTIDRPGELASTLDNSRRVCVPAPAVPARVAVHPGVGSVEVSWTAARATARWPVRAYVATAMPGRHHCSTLGELHCTISGLHNGTTYRISVSAVNVTGPGAPSPPVLVVAGAPDVPRSVAVSSPAARTARASWQAPATSGSSTVTGYQVRWSSDGGRVWTPWTTPRLGSFAARTHLVVGHRYVVQVRAINRVGAGPSATVTFRQAR